MAVDGGDGETAVAARPAASKHGCRGDAGQRHVERQGEAARGGEADAHAGEAARPDGDGDQRQRAAFDAGLLQHRGDRGQQPRRLVAALLAHDGQGAPSRTTATPRPLTAQSKARTRLIRWRSRRWLGIVRS